MKLRHYKSNGKLLLTGEYVVLDGAIALAVPTQYGQSLYINPIEERKLHWISFDEIDNVWFEDNFDIPGNKMLKHTSAKLSTSVKNDSDIGQRLKQILSAVKTLNPNFLNSKHGFEIETYLDFPKNWGLGTSSTLINNIAQWANVDAFKLLELTFGGSGYDIACAQHDTAITYQLLNKNELLKHTSTKLSAGVKGDNRRVKTVDFNPSFKDNLYFVYLNKKQNSREGIAHYKALKQDLSPVISEINSITEQMITCEDLKTFQKLIEAHEHIISKIIQQHTVTSQFFNDFDGAIKSLGAWGGDFILAACETDPMAYFNKKGFDIVIPYHKMVM